MRFFAKYQGVDTDRLEGSVVSLVFVRRLSYQLCAAVTDSVGTILRWYQIAVLRQRCYSLEFEVRGDAGDQI